MHPFVGFPQVKPYMHALYTNRYPGSSITYDGTYKMANLTRGLARVLMIAMGELGHMMGHVFVPSESWSHLLPFWSRYVCLRAVPYMVPVESNVVWQNRHRHVRLSFDDAATYVAARGLAVF